MSGMGFQPQFIGTDDLTSWRSEVLNLQRVLRSTRDNCAESKEEIKEESKVSEELLHHSPSGLQPPLNVDGWIERTSSACFFPFCDCMLRNCGRGL